MPGNATPSCMRGPPIPSPNHDVDVPTKRIRPMRWLPRLQIYQNIQILNILTCLQIYQNIQILNILTTILQVQNPYVRPQYSSPSVTVRESTVKILKIRIFLRRESTVKILKIQIFLRIVTKITATAVQGIVSRATEVARVVVDKLWGGPSSPLPIATGQCTHAPLVQVALKSSDWPPRITMVAWTVLLTSQRRTSGPAVTGK
jgi:hypothetical protein